jgi:hypothetical protein
MAALDGGALPLPLREKEITTLFPLQRGSREGDGDLKEFRTVV